MSRKTRDTRDSMWQMSFTRPDTHMLQQYAWHTQTPSFLYLSVSHGEEKSNSFYIPWNSQEYEQGDEAFSVTFFL